MKTVLLASVLLIVPASALAQSPTAEDLTRMLNGAPPAARPVQPRPQPQPQTQPVAPRSTPAPAPVSPRTTAAPTSTAAPNPAPRPVQPPASATVAPRPAPAQAQPPVRAPVVSTPAAPTRSPPATAPEPSRAPSATPAPAASAVALPPAAVAALPFRIDLSSGFQLFENRGAADAHVWSVRRAGKTFAMIYAGPASQFPIYDGEQVTAAGRTTVIVPEGARRIAMEHLFQRPSAPAEIHVWLMSLDGADRDAAERIAQSVDPK